MSAALEAHKRLLVLLKEKITTHLAKSWDSRKGWSTPITDELVNLYATLKSQGMKYNDIRRELHASTVVMKKLGGRVK